MQGLPCHSSCFRNWAECIKCPKTHIYMQNIQGPRLFRSSSAPPANSKSFVSTTVIMYTLQVLPCHVKFCEEITRENLWDYHDNICLFLKKIRHCWRDGNRTLTSRLEFGVLPVRPQGHYTFCAISKAHHLWPYDSLHHQLQELEL